MARTKTGSTVRKGKDWYARITFYDDSGKRVEKRRKADNKTHAKDLCKQMLRELDDHGEQTLDAAQMTFGELADHYEKDYLNEPVYVDSRKVSGMRSSYDMKLKLKILKNHFGKRKLRSITHGDIGRFRGIRLNTPTKQGGQRSISTVNRELSLLRRVFNVAKRNRWIINNPFSEGGSLISPGDERHRERIVTREEEENLLAACTGRRAHLRPLIICALDTGMRRGEIFKLRWSDLDFENRVIIVQGLHTKTLRERTLAMTERLREEFSALYEQSTKEQDCLVFGFTSNVKKSFSSVRKIAGLLDVRFHDLRHTHATRLVGAHIPLSEVGRVLGHTQANTTYRYVNANVETARRAAAALDEFNKSVGESEKTITH